MSHLARNELNLKGFSSWHVHCSAALTFVSPYLQVQNSFLNWSKHFRVKWSLKKANCWFSQRKLRKSETVFKIWCILEIRSSGKIWWWYRQKMSTPYGLYGKQDKTMFENVSASAPFRIDVNSIINDFSSVSIESLGVYRDHLNISVILYCFLWRKLYIIVILRDLKRSWDIWLINI